MNGCDVSTAAAVVMQDEQGDLVFPPGMTAPLIPNDVHGKFNPDQIISGCLVMLIACVMLMRLEIEAPRGGQ